MIRIDISHTVDSKISGFTMEGHANFADKGEDIVCAGVSAVAFGSLNAVISLTGIEPEITTEENGFLKCILPHSLSDEVSEKVQLLLEGMIVSLQTIEREYPDFVKIKFR
ncbi:ribosomal-processing cysteine protease Prp [Lederbergia sp. NSJ-179]|uniref:ribosomal-processing cysteine protease Prp n=1 Tax=Lederbergia sp. NSJ-179 TaxID=2931402 RepID=UPI001FD23697|nr:ribosomal-processing cysteine protease Prp [Lederbergia sp. NSJ-179]MCJ7839908.1 ribosomal-processing cysteine protease Prp [Lederbergia sp. NSJ-179]